MPACSDAPRWIRSSDRSPLSGPARSSASRPLAEVIGGLDERGPGDGPLSGRLPERDGFARFPRAAPVVGDDLRLALGERLEARGEERGHLAVQRAPAPAQQPRVRRVLQQRVRELEPGRERRPRGGSRRARQASRSRRRAAPGPRSAPPRTRGRAPPRRRSRRCTRGSRSSRCVSRPWSVGGTSVAVESSRWRAPWSASILSSSSMNSGTPSAPDRSVSRPLAATIARTSACVSGPSAIVRSAAHCGSNSRR